MNAETAAAVGKVLADALAANTVLTELDLCSNHLKPEFAQEFAVGLKSSRYASSKCIHGSI